MAGSGGVAGIPARVEILVHPIELAARLLGFLLALQFGHQRILLALDLEQRVTELVLARDQRLVLTARLRPDLIERARAIIRVQIRATLAHSEKGD